MDPPRGFWHTLPGVAGALAVLVLLVIGGAAPVEASHSAPGVSRIPLQINGDWTISSHLVYRNATIEVNGSVSIVSGGNLTLEGSTLELTEPTSLAHGITIARGGSLQGIGLTVGSSTPGNDLWMQADAGSSLALSGGSVGALGGPGGPPGLTIGASRASIFDVTFDGYYEALIVSNAANVSVEDCQFLNSTSTDSSTYAVQVTGASPGFRLTRSAFLIPQSVGALFLAAPSAEVDNNTFSLNPNGTSEYPVLLGYTGLGQANASGTQFLGNFVYGSDITDLASSNVEISNNRVVNDGLHKYGIHAMVPIGTVPGLWVSGLVVENNTVSDTSCYGIRVEQNVTDFQIRGNRIVDPSTSPQPPYFWNSKEITGIYAIRGVNNGSIADNVLELADSPAILSEGIVLEADVNYVVVSGNEIRNVTGSAVNVQGDIPGDDSAEPYQTGPSLHDQVLDNLIVNEIPIQQTAIVGIAIVIWDWANFTVVENNTIVGWNLINSAFEYNGAALLTSASYGVIANNTVDQARYGFLFTNFAGDTANPPGTFNRSWNLVYGNVLYGISQAPVVEDSSDGQGPITNDINVLDNTRTPAGTPLGYFETINGANGISTAESAGTYDVTLTAVDPITGQTERFLTQIAWDLPPFALATTGPIAAGHMGGAVVSVNDTELNYSVTAAGGLAHSVRLNVPAVEYSADYAVRVYQNRHEVSAFAVNSTTGPAAFETQGTGNLTVAVLLVSWNASSSGNRTPPPSNESTNMTLETLAETAAGSPVANLTVSVALSNASGPASWESEATNVSGVALLANLPSGLNVTSVAIQDPNYDLVSYSVGRPQNNTTLLTVVVNRANPSPNGSGQNRTPANMTLETLAETAGGSPVGNLSLSVELTNTTGPASWDSEATNASGIAVLAGLPLNTNVSSVTVEGSRYALSSYSTRGPQNGTEVLTVVVDAVNPPANSTSQNRSAQNNSVATVSEGATFRSLPIVLVMSGVLVGSCSLAAAYLGYEALLRREHRRPQPVGKDSEDRESPR
jgi:hypothetical protein